MSTHIVVPSVPGFGFSAPPRGTGRNITCVARIWAELMHRLGYRHNTIVHWPEGNPAGHHFVAMEQPDHVAADIREFFGKIR